MRYVSKLGGWVVGLFLVVSLALPLRAETPAERLSAAWDMYSAGKYEDAKKAFEAITRDDPKNAEAAGGLGGCLMNLGSNEEAVPLLRKGADAFPDRSWYPQNIACALANVGKWEEASQSAREALRKGSTSAVPHAIVGEFARQQKQWKEAQDELELAVTLDSNYGFALSALADLHRDLQHHGLAIALYREALRFSPKSTAAMNGAARLLITQVGYFDEGIDLAKKSIEIDPKNDFPFYLLSEGYAKKQMWKESLEAAQSAARLAPNDAWDHFNVARALRGLGRVDDARAEVKKALELDKTLGPAKDLEKELASK